MKKKFWPIFFLSLLLLTKKAFFVDLRKVELNEKGEVEWQVNELKEQDNEGINLISSKFNVYKVVIKNHLAKPISISLTNYFYGFSRDLIEQDNVLVDYKEILDKTKMNKLLFYGPFWFGLLNNIFMYINIHESENSSSQNALNLKENSVLTSAFILQATFAVWSFLGWLFKIKKLNHTKKLYDLLGKCKSHIKLSRLFFNRVEPKIVANQLIIPARAKFKDYLFIPLGYPIKLDNAVLVYSVG